MLSIAKSHKSSSDKELINWNTLEENGHMQILGISRSEDITTQAQIDIDASNKDLSFRKSLRFVHTHTHFPLIPLMKRTSNKSGRHR